MEPNVESAMKSDGMYSPSESPTQDMRGEGYAPVFDHLIAYGQRTMRSTDVEDLLYWCKTKVDHCFCKVKEYINALDYRKQLQESRRQIIELEIKLKEAEKKAAVLQSNTTVSSLPPPPPPVPCALPPPPPPPLPAVKAPPSQKLIINRKNSDRLKPQKSLSQLVVTPEAIKNIKLRKADDRITAFKDPNTPGLVTLEALKSVSLRRTQSATTINEVGKENIHQLLAHEVLHRRTLRKTTMRRSPGGTPLSDKKRRRDSGQGLTPVMSRALKRKFRLAKCESLSSDESSGALSTNSSPDVSLTNPINSTSSLTNLTTPNTSSYCSPLSAQNMRSSPLAEISTNIISGNTALSASSPNLVF
ncbi:hypothetical protein SNE40_003604 [Patella caerulea]|uniref:Uncharacterized protein n=1 Tax=Patella caerulea TaxID=87958 RepID=A0AAN8KEI9_PATCE